MPAIKRESGENVRLLWRPGGTTVPLDKASSRNFDALLLSGGRKHSRLAQLGELDASAEHGA